MIKNNFIKIEEYILEFGLKAFMVVNGDLEKTFNSLVNRLKYDRDKINTYLVHLDAVYQLRTKFLKTLHVQNVIKECEKNITVNEMEIQKMKSILKETLNYEHYL